MERLKYILLCAIFTVTASVADESKLVNIAQGPVRGYKNSEHAYYAFKSIPYASAPTGPNRFKAPLPPPIWIQPLEAVDKGIACPQIEFQAPVMPQDLNMREDCLIANVYVPDTEEQNLPVVIYVHGGGFQVGLGDWSVPSLLMVEHKIIYVTFNYRLGPHGFLSLGTDAIPGNAGMKDQVAALRWVKKNIANFGGNPDDITIHGSSGGSASVELLMLSKSAEGLFNRIIPESGAGIAAWAIQSDPLENAKRLAKVLNFTDLDNAVALEEFYKTVPFDQLISHGFLSEKDSSFVFSPCVEAVTSEEIFLDKSPVDILKSGSYRKVPLLYGFADMEGLIRIQLFDFWKNDMNEKFSDFLPSDLKFDSEEQKEEVAQQIKALYFEDKLINEETILAYIDYFTDVMFAYPMLRSIKLHVEAGHNQIYLYEYSFVDDNTPYVPYTNVKGADHSAQTAAVFAGGLNNTEEFNVLSSIVRTLWSNFIKTSKPVSEGSSLPLWPAVGQGWSPHMAIGSELHLEGPLLERRMRFWDQIYSQYYRVPVAAQSSASHYEINRIISLILLLIYSIW